MAMAAPTTNTTASVVHARLPMTHAGKSKPGAQLWGGSDRTGLNAAGAPRAKASVAVPPADTRTHQKRRRTQARAVAQSSRELAWACAQAGAAMQRFKAPAQAQRFPETFSVV
jgi:hypothetical protein